MSEFRQGWFPAKFVQVIDERGRDYCVRGDEAVCPRIAELARGPLAFALRQILCHGCVFVSVSYLPIFPYQNPSCRTSTWRNSPLKHSRASLAFYWFVNSALLLDSHIFLFRSIGKRIGAYSGKKAKSRTFRTFEVDFMQHFPA